LDLYYKIHSILVTVETLSRFGALIGNSGFSPFTDECFIKSETIKVLLPLMILCGMNVKAGKFARAHGLPSKNSISGALLTIIP
jgi:glutaminase